MAIGSSSYRVYANRLPNSALEIEVVPPVPVGSRHIIEGLAGHMAVLGYELISPPSDKSTIGGFFLIPDSDQPAKRPPVCAVYTEVIGYMKRQGLPPNEALAHSVRTLILTGLPANQPADRTPKQWFEDAEAQYSNV